MDTKYHVRFTGNLQTGLSHEDVVANLVTLTNLDKEKAGALLLSGKPVILKKDAVLEMAEKYRTVFEKAGMMIQVEKAGATLPPNSIQSKPETDQQKIIPTRKPPQQSLADKQEPSGYITENPYTAPKSNLKAKKETRELWGDQPRKVSASRGLFWLKSAVSMYFERQWIWMGMWLILILIVTIMNFVPFVGPLCAILLMAVLKGGVMLAAEAHANGQQIQIGHVFQGFSHNRNQLLLVGFYYLLIFALFGILCGIIISIGAFSGIRAGNTGSMAAVLANNIPLFFLFFLLMLLLAVPFMMAYWFAPALTAVADKTAWNAYKLSFRGCLKNWAPFLVYSMALLGIGIILILLIMMISWGLIHFIFQGGSSLMVFPIIIIAAVFGFPLACIFGLSIYAGFKDIFYQSA